LRPLIRLNSERVAVPYYRLLSKNKINSILNNKSFPDTADEEDELKKLQGKEAADQAIFSDSGANQYDRRSTPGIEIDKSTAYDFMSSMQESNDEEQNMLKSKSTAPVVAATVEEVLPAEPSLASSMIVPDLEASTIIKRSIDDSEYSGAKSDNEAFIISMYFDRSY
jgi:hypothetical protein